MILNCAEKKGVRLTRCTNFKYFNNPLQDRKKNLAGN
jgi:hypothetical protein